jgi:surface polysaccharide O-acyltransferase-like enzyme
MNNKDENSKENENNKLIINDSKKMKIYYYFFILRIISSFAVVLIHVSNIYYFGCKKISKDFKISFFYSAFSRFGVPVFYMISGALFLNRDRSFRIIYSKNIKKILIRLIIWSFIYSISSFKISKKNIKKIIFKFFSGHYHLWFLLSIIGLYILVPFLREVAKNEELLKMFILLSLIFTFLFPNFIIIISYYSKSYFEIFNSIYRNLNLNYISGNIFYFMTGYYLNNNNTKFNIYKTLFIYIIVFFGTLFTFKLSYNIVLKYNIKNTPFFSSGRLNIAVYSISIFIFIKNQFINKMYNQKLSLIKIISNNTFGIYLVHPLIIQKAKKIILKFTLCRKILFLIPMFTSFTYLSSLLISIMIKYIPLIGKYLM